MMSVQESAEARRLVEQTYDAFEALASSAWKAKLVKHQADPSPVERRDKGIDQWRIRLLPTRREMQPVKFWSSSWCFYEIAVGRLGAPFARSDIGQVQFFQASNNSQCGNGKYLEAVKQVLEKSETCLPQFKTIVINDRSAYFHLARRYSPIVNGGYGPHRAAEDLIRLIEVTLPQVQAL